jgi:hypothetical protein
MAVTMTEHRSVEHLTKALAAETNKRADILQQHAFKASSKLLRDEDVDFFVVSREYHSGVFYGFLTSVPFDKIPPMVAGSAVKPDDIKPNDSTGGIVGSFRDVFSRSFERPGPLQTLSDLLNKQDATGCSAIAVLFDGNGSPCGTKFFDLDLNAIDPPPECLYDKLASENLIDQPIAKVAAAIAAQKVSANVRTIKGGFCLIVSANQPISDQESIRRKPLHLMQIMLQVGITSEILKTGNWTLSNDMKSVLISSSVAAFSVLYERERYFEKAIRQSIKGTMIKWGGKDSQMEFYDQIKALNQCNKNVVSHAAPYILKYGFPKTQTDPIPDDDRNSDRNAHYPWYEMVRYSLPSLDDLLTTTPDLQDFEVRAIAKAVVDHLNKHFWNLDAISSKENLVRTVPLAAIPVLAFATLRDELSNNDKDIGSIEKIKIRMSQWRDGIPIQVDKKGITLPNNVWVDSNGSLWQAFFACELKNKETGAKESMYSGFCDENDVCIIKFPINNPEDVLDTIIRKWTNSEIESPTKITVPDFLAAHCHGDPHFENIFIDASIPEDSFIVTIDPAIRKYNGDMRAGAGLCKETAKEIIENFGRQPMHDISKLLLSTVGGYALAQKNGFSAGFERAIVEGDSELFALRWHSKHNVSPLGADATGVSGANLYMRSISATSDAKRYQYIFSLEVLDQFDRIIEQMLNFSGISDDKDKCICRNIYYIQIWAWVVRHTFSISEKMFPDRHDVSDQLLVFGSYLLHFGAKYLSESGLNCLSSEATHKRFKCLLSLSDIMEQAHD